MVALHTEFIENAIAHLGIVAQNIIPALGLFLHLFVGEQVTFERCHSCLAEQRRLGTTPEIPEEVGILFACCLVGVVVERGTGHALNLFKEFLTFDGNTVEHNLAHRAILVYGHCSMEHEVRVVYYIHATTHEQTLHMVLQTFAMQERVTQTLNNILLLGCKGVWVGRVECGPLFVEHFVLIAVDFNYTALLVYEFHETAVHHVPFGVSHSYLSR